MVGENMKQLELSAEKVRIDDRQHETAGVVS